MGNEAPVTEQEKAAFKKGQVDVRQEGSDTWGNALTSVIGPGTNNPPSDPVLRRHYQNGRKNG